MRFLVLVLITLVLASCGYRPVGGGSCPLLAGEKLAVDLLGNRTTEPYLENELTNALIVELATDQRLSVDGTNATVRLEGEVVDYIVGALSFDRDDEINEYRLTLRVSVRLVRLIDGRHLWRQTIEREAEFPASPDRTIQQDNERRAIQRAAEQLAEDLRVELCLAKDGG